MELDEIIEVCRDVLRRLEKERQARLAEYRDFATVCFKGRVTVDFGDCGSDYRGRRAIGSSASDSIRIVPGLPVAAERSVFVHELCHVHLKHSEAPRRCTGRPLRLLRTHSNSLKTTVDSLPEEARADFIAEIERKEREAHALAKELHPILFPGQPYVLRK